MRGAPDTSEIGFSWQQDVSMLDALMAYNGSLFGPSLVAIALLLTMGVMATFSRTRIPALVMVWMGLLAAVGSLGVSWFSMLQIRSIFFSNGVHVRLWQVTSSCCRRCATPVQCRSVSGAFEHCRQRFGRALGDELCELPRGREMFTRRERRHDIWHFDMSLAADRDSGMDSGLRESVLAFSPGCAT